MTAERILENITESLSKLDAAAINKKMLRFFNARSCVGSGFAIGLRRREDSFILQGLKPYLDKLESGQSISICEKGAGSSMPVSFCRTVHSGQPWLSRTIAYAAGSMGISDRLKVCVSDIHALSSQFSIVDSEGILLCFSLPPDVKKFDKFTSLHQPLPFDQLLGILTKEELEGLVTLGASTESWFTHRPYLDPEFEALYNLEVSGSRYDSLEGAENRKYDFIYGRHLRQSDNPHNCSEEFLLKIVNAVQGMLTDGGEARLVFDTNRFWQPKTALIVRQGYYHTQFVPFW